MWGIIPAAGSATRIQPLAFSKELLPVGRRLDERGAERPRAVSEYLIERMARAGVDRICFVISPWKSDILQYYGGEIGDVALAYVIQNRPAGLCDAVFRALPLIHPDDAVIVGLPDTIWFPAEALCGLPDDRFSFLLFPVDRPHLFDAVETDGDGRVLRIAVKSAVGAPGWIWGAFKLPGHVLHALAALWRARDCQDEYIGTLVNAWLANGGAAYGVRRGEQYVDVGTLDGFREASRLLDDVSPMGDFAIAPQAPRKPETR